MRAKENTVSVASASQDRKIVNLKFLDDFMKRMDLSNADIAKAMKISRQGVGYWFIHDDATVSKMQEVFDAFGYTLSFNFVQNHPNQENPAVVQMMLEKKDDQPIFGSRLEFLNRAIKVFKLNKVELTKKMKVGATTIYYWQSHDDCLMSNLYLFAQHADLSLNITITPKDMPEEVVEFNDAKAEAPVALERYEEVKRQMNIISVLYDGFIGDAEKVAGGDESVAPRARRATLHIADMLKEYRKLSVEAEK